MQILPVKTRALRPPKDSLYPVLDALELKEGDIVLITSKVLAIHQGRCVPIAGTDKAALIRSEAEAVFAHPDYPDLPLTRKEHALVPAAGIDESNGNGYYVLWPRDVTGLLKEFAELLRRKHKLNNLALIATDSSLMPMRAGVIGIAIGFHGLRPLRDYRGTKDLFGRTMRYTQANIPDALAAIAGLHMGEGDECVPIVIVRGMEGVAFTEKDVQDALVMPEEQDLYGPLLKRFKK